MAWAWRRARRLAVVASALGGATALDACGSSSNAELTQKPDASGASGAAGSFGTGDASAAGGSTGAGGSTSALPDGATSRAPCTTDKQCRAAGLLCNVRGGYCAQCVLDSHCGAGEHCENDVCVPNGCAGGSSCTTPDASAAGGAGGGTGAGGSTSAAGAGGADASSAGGSGAGGGSPGGAGGTTSAGGAGGTTSAGGAGGTTSAGGAGGTTNAGGAGGTTSAGGTSAAGGSAGAGGTGAVCPGGMGAVTSMRMKEVYTGNVDYLILVNADATCSANISGMVLSLHWTGTGNGLDVTLPSLTLGPGETVVVTEGIPELGQIQTNANINWGGTTNPGNAMLCTGLCTTAGGGSVVDLMSFSRGTTAPPALPAPLSFTPLNAITSSTENGTAYVHVGSTGSYPAFQSSDWSTAAATYPVNGTCPALTPRPGTSCTSLAASCTYGSVSCTCSIVGMWTCS